MEKKLIALAACAVIASPVVAEEHGHMSGRSAMEAHAAVSDKVIADQRKTLATNTKGKGFGPQAP